MRWQSRNPRDSGFRKKPLPDTRAFDPRVWLLALGTFAIGTDAFVVSGILSAVAGDLRIGLDAAGQVVTAYALTYALNAPVLAALTARLPRERIVTRALGLFALANVLHAGADLHPPDCRARAGRRRCRPLHADCLRARRRAGAAGAQGIRTGCGRPRPDGLCGTWRAVRRLTWPAPGVARHLLVCGPALGRCRRGPAV